MPRDLGQLESIARFGFPSRYTPPADTPAESPIHNAARAVGDLQQIAQSVVEAVRRIDDDPRLTEEGKRDSLAKLGADPLAKLDALETVILTDRVRELIDRAEASLRSKLSGSTDDPLLAELRKQEVRRVLASMDEQARSEAYRRAIESGDSLTFSAFIDAPAVLPLLHPRAAEEGKRLWLEKTNPREAAELRALKEADAVLTEGINTVRDGIHKATGTKDESLRARIGAVRS